MVEDSVKKKRIEGVRYLYYSKPEVQKAIFEFCKDRETIPQYFEGFGKRPDSLQYVGDIFELVKKGATSFHCSEEIWEDALRISTELSEEEFNNLRTGWDLLIDIDCKYFDYAKRAALATVETLRRFGIENIGLKFSGSKGFHIIVPWKAFPKEINGIPTEKLFPDLPRRLIEFIRDYSEKVFEESLPENYEKEFEKAKVKKGIKCKNCNELVDIYDKIELYCPFCKSGEIKKVSKEFLKENYGCPNCKRDFILRNKKEIYECKKCGINSIEKPESFSLTKEIDLFDLMGLDFILISPRHLFRAPYSLHEKTGLASVVLTKAELKDFEPKQANPLDVRIRSFSPEAKENEAKQLIVEALDWSKSKEISEGKSQEKVTGKYANFKPIKITELKDDQFPPCIQSLFKGLEDGKKRGLFILINMFRSIGMEKQEMEKKISEWNQKNKPPLKQGYIQGQLKWNYDKKPKLPPNCKKFYQEIGICKADMFCSKIKNPLNYVIRKNFSKNKIKKNINKKS